MKLSPRQRQISVLKQRGASNKEIALVLGVEESTIKSQYKLMRQKCMENGVDIYAVPINRVERMAFFRNLARVEYYKLKFGGEDEQGRGFEGQEVTAGTCVKGTGHTQTDHRAIG